MEAITLGKTIENGSIRIHRFRDTLRITDITNAGKRGKNVDRISVSENLYYDTDAVALNNLESELENKDVTTLSEVVEIANKYSAVTNIYTGTERGVDVKPAGFKTIVLDNDKVRVEADYDTFTVKCKVDMYNEPVAIPHWKYSKKTMIKKFYKWASSKALQDTEGYNDILSEVRDNDIVYHSFCAVD
jgi:hypothetical protein